MKIKKFLRKYLKIFKIIEKICKTFEKNLINFGKEYWKVKENFEKKKLENWKIRKL